MHDGTGGRVARTLPDPRRDEQKKRAEQLRCAAAHFFLVMRVTERMGKWRHNSPGPPVKDLAAVARAILAERVRTVGPPAAASEFEREHVDWERPCRAERNAAQRLIDALREP